MAKKLIACDFDGTLFDTNLANQQAYNEALSNFGYTMSYDYFVKRCNGKNYKDFLPQIIGFDDEKLMQEIHNLKKKCYEKYYSLIVVNEHLFEMLFNRPKYCQAAIVTTAARSSVLDILTTFSKEKAFDFIIAKEDVIFSKPHPEGYLKAMKTAGTTPASTIIYEDSNTGLAAARATGATVMVVQDFSSKINYQSRLRTALTI